MAVFVVVSGAYAVIYAATTDTQAITGCAPSGAWNSSAQFGNHSDGGFVFNNNMWGTVTGSKQEIWELSPSSWGICAKEPNPPGGVKSYAEEQKEINRTIGGLSSASFNVGFKVPSHGTWNASADLWVNGHPGDAGVKEIMIWPYTHYQQPAGSKVGTATIYNVAYNVWVRSGTNPTYTFQRQNNTTSTTIHMLTTFNWLISHGYLHSSDTFTQFNWGYEIIGTSGYTEKWTTTSFGLTIN